MSLDDNTLWPPYPIYLRWAMLPKGCENSGIVKIWNNFTIYYWRSDSVLSASELKYDRLYTCVINQTNCIIPFASYELSPGQPYPQNYTLSLTNLTIDTTQHIINGTLYVPLPTSLSRNNITGDLIINIPTSTEFSLGRDHLFLIDLYLTDCYGRKPFPLAYKFKFRLIDYTCTNVSNNLLVIPPPVENPITYRVYSGTKTIEFLKPTYNTTNTPGPLIDPDWANYNGYDQPIWNQTQQTYDAPVGDWLINNASLGWISILNNTWQINTTSPLAPTCQKLFLTHFFDYPCVQYANYTLNVTITICEIDTLVTDNFLTDKTITYTLRNQSNVYFTLDKFISSKPADCNYTPSTPFIYYIKSLNSGQTDVTLGLTVNSTIPAVIANTPLSIPPGTYEMQWWLIPAPCPTFNNTYHNFTFVVNSVNLTGIQRIQDQASYNCTLDQNLTLYNPSCMSQPNVTNPLSQLQPLHTLTIDGVQYYLNGVYLYSINYTLYPILPSWIQVTTTNIYVQPNFNISLLGNHTFSVESSCKDDYQTIMTKSFIYTVEIVCKILNVTSSLVTNFTYSTINQTLTFPLLIATNQFPACNVTPNTTFSFDSDPLGNFTLNVTWFNSTNTTNQIFAQDSFLAQKTYYVKQKNQYTNDYGTYDEFYLFQVFFNFSDPCINTTFLNFPEQQQIYQTFLGEQYSLKMPNYPQDSVSLNLGMCDGYVMCGARQVLLIQSATGKEIDLESSLIFTFDYASLTLVYIPDQIGTVEYTFQYYLVLNPQIKSSQVILLFENKEPVSLTHPNFYGGPALSYDLESGKILNIYFKILEDEGNCFTYKVNYQTIYDFIVSTSETCQAGKVDIEINIFPNYTQSNVTTTVIIQVTEDSPQRPNPVTIYKSFELHIYKLPEIFGLNQTFNETIVFGNSTLDAFNRIDINHDSILSYEEFMQAMDLLQIWGIDISNIYAQWQSVDKDHSGELIFQEFSDWVIERPEFVTEILKKVTNETQQVNASYIPDSWKKLEIKIESISRLALVNVVFSQSINLVKQLHILTFTQNSEELPLQFNWTCPVESGNFSDNSIQFQLLFSKPFSVSAGKYPDTVHIYLAYTFPNSTKIYQQKLFGNLPMLIGSEEEFRKLTLISDTINESATFLFWLYIALFIFFSIAISMLWGTFQTLQIIIAMPLLKVKIPANVLQLYKGFTDIVNMKIIDLKKVYGWIFGNDEIQKNLSDFTPMNFTKTPIKATAAPLNITILRYLQQNETAEVSASKFLNFNKSDVVSNVIMMIIGVIALLIIIALILIIQKYVYPKLPKLVKRLITAIKHKLMWNSVLRYIAQSYLDITIKCFLCLSTFYDLTLKSQVINIFTSVYVIFIPAFIALLIWRNRDQLHKQQIKESIGSLYMNYELDKKSVVHFTTIFLYRRLVFAVAVAFCPYVVIQIQIVYLSSFLLLIYLIIWSPMDGDIYDFLAFFNECVLWVSSSIMLLYTEYVPDPELRYNFGSILMYLLYINFGLNIILLIFELTRLIIRNCKQFYSHRRQRLQRQIARSINEQKQDQAVQQILNQQEERMKEQQNVKQDLLNQHEKMPKNATDIIKSDTNLVTLFQPMQNEVNIPNWNEYNKERPHWSGKKLEDLEQIYKDAIQPKTDLQQVSSPFPGIPVEEFQLIFGGDQNSKQIEKKDAKVLNLVTGKNVEKKPKTVNQEINPTKSKQDIKQKSKNLQTKMMNDLSGIEKEIKNEPYKIGLWAFKH